MSRPNVENIAEMPWAIPRPSSSPRVAPTSPTTNASKSTARRTCGRLAPMARRSASSRERCATRIEKVLTMRKDPTTRAMPAKTSRKVEMNDSACPTWSSLFLASSAPVRVS